jgi:hypothetical protein
MAKQTFTTGQVLTAAQMTSLQANDYNWTVSAQTASYVLVATNAGQHVTMNSASNTTITVNTALFTAGDTLRITNISTGTATITAGTATVTTAGSLALSQWASGILYFTSASAAIFFPDAKTSGGQGLTCVKTETAFTAASSFTADSVFTSSYTNYLMIVNLTTVSGTGTLQLRTGGVASTASYNYNTIVGSAGTLSNLYTSAGASLSLGTVSNNVIIPIEIYGPQLAAPTSFYAKSHEGTSAGNQKIISGVHNVSTAYDGIAMSFTTGTGTYTIYGYGKSV